MLLRELISESTISERATSVLFHYTSVLSALRILQSGEFSLSSVTGNKSEEQYAPRGYPYFLSLTRTITGDYHRFVGSSGVMFKLNGDWLGNRYPVKPMDYWDRAWLHSDGTRTRESEDRVFSRDPSIPIGGITEIHLLLKEPDPGRGPQVRKLMLLAKQADIPCYLYNDEAGWRLLDKRKSIPISQARELLGGVMPSMSPYAHRKPTDFVKPWIELIEKSDVAHLSDRAKSKLKSITYYYYPHEKSDHQLGIDLSNARKPGAGDRESAVKLINYMHKNGYGNDTVKLIDDLHAKWSSIQNKK